MNRLLGFLLLGALCGPVWGQTARAEGAQIDALRRNVKAMLARSDYAGLDAMAAGLRKSRARWPSGKSQLQSFYGALNEDDDAKAEASVKRLDAWCKASPTSVAALVGKGSAYTSYAWAARGGGYADSVTSQGWKLFGERLQVARLALQQAAQLAPDDPGPAVALITVDMGQDKPFQADFNRAVSIDPDNLEAYQRAVTCLLPRWGGRPGDEARLAQEASKHSHLGKGMYAVVAWYVVAYTQETDDLGMDWPQIQEGFLALLKLYPQSGTWLNRYAMLACMHKDRVTAGRLLDKIGNDSDPELWDASTLAKAREWAKGK